jgi:hypothetical protein
MVIIEATMHLAATLPAMDIAPTMVMVQNMDMPLVDSLVIGDGMVNKSVRGDDYATADEKMDDTKSLSGVGSLSVITGA